MQKAKLPMVDVRQSWLRLPKQVQGFLTWFSGKPYEGQEPTFKRTRISHLLSSYFVLFAGVGVSVIGILFPSLLSILLVPLGWILTVSGARKLATTINHYCVHQDMFPLHWKTACKYHWLIADFNAIICFLQPFSVYREEHMDHHNIKNVATLRDPDMIFMWFLGFKAGMSKKELWKNLYKTLFSGWFHLIFFRARLMSSFENTKWIRKMLVMFHVFLILSVALFVSWQIALFAWVIPIIILYQASALLHFTTEHRWLKDTDSVGSVEDLDRKECIVRSKTLTAGRFSGEMAPDTSDDGWLTSTWKWSKWVLRMLFLYLPIRLFVFPGDLPQHDWHHRAKFGDDWANAAYTRQKALENLNSSEEPYMEVWGLYAAIDAVFESLSKMPQLEVEEAQEELDTDAILAM